jgi:hypothetical protein
MESDRKNISTKSRSCWPWPMRRIFPRKLPPQRIWRPNFWPVTVPNDRLRLCQPPTDFDNVPDRALAERANDFGVLGEFDIIRRDEFDVSVHRRRLCRVAAVLSPRRIPAGQRSAVPRLPEAMPSLVRRGALAARLAQASGIITDLELLDAAFQPGDVGLGRRGAGVLRRFGLVDEVAFMRRPTRPARWPSRPCARPPRRSPSRKPASRRSPSPPKRSRRAGGGRSKRQRMGGPQPLRP